VTGAAFDRDFNALIESFRWNSQRSNFFRSALNLTHRENDHPSGWPGLFY